ncbi:peptidase [Gammaproteobacteria bacterium]|nr:peptidase [Gammaproteobacteria bacterium]
MLTQVKLNISAEMVACGSSCAFGLCEDQSKLYWLEALPSEQGRVVIQSIYLNSRSNKIKEIPINHFKDTTYSVRSRVHEYGGGAMTVTNGLIAFVNALDQNIYLIYPEIAEQIGEQAGLITALTANTDTTVNISFADLQIAGTYLYAIRETHHPKVTTTQNIVKQGTAKQDTSNVINELVRINLHTKEIQIMHQGYDFYISPRINPQLTQLAFIAWNHPNMPWDATNLGILNLENMDDIDNPYDIQASFVKSDIEESILQPVYAPNGDLYVMSDRSIQNGDRFWNLFKVLNPNQAGYILENVFQKSADFAKPAWIFGQSNLAFLGKDHALLSYVKTGNWSLGIINLSTQEFTAMPELPFCEHDELITYVDKDTQKYTAILSVGLPTAASQVIQIKLNLNNKIIYEKLLPLSQDSRNQDPLDQNQKDNIDNMATCYCKPKLFEFDGYNNNKTYANLYLPKKTGDLPKLRVIAHGGPTGQASSSLNLNIQFWVERGYAVLDVNYTGSTGFGRNYRERLKGLWGIADVIDCVKAAQAVVAQGLVDPNALTIRGSSAGGFSVLCALTFHTTFHAGASYYGIGNLASLVEDTHKFEAYYINALLSQNSKDLSLDDWNTLFKERSPIEHIEKLQTPVIFFQGMQDKVVLPNQAEQMAAALKNNKIYTRSYYFEDEGHGFRNTKNIIQALTSEFDFYEYIFNKNSPSPKQE